MKTKILRWINKRKSKKIAKFIRSRRSTAQDKLWYWDTMKEWECKSRLDCRDSALEDIAHEIEMGLWI